MKNWMIGSAMCIAMSCVGPAWAGPATDAVQPRVARLMAMPAGAPGATGVMDELFAYEVIAEDCIAGRHAGLDEETWGRYYRAMTDLIRASYRKNVAKLKGVVLKYGSEKIEGDTATVKVDGVRKGERVELEFRLLKVGGRWRVVDVVTEGVSMVKTYRAQFRKVIDSQGFDALLKKMSVKLGVMGKEG